MYISIVWNFVGIGRGRGQVRTSRVGGMPDMETVYLHLESFGGVGT